MPHNRKSAAIKSAIVTPSILAGTPPSVHPLRDSVFSLAHHPMSGSDTICNSSNSPLTDIVLLGLSLKVFKTHLLGRFLHPYKECFFAPPTWDLTISLMHHLCTSFPSPIDVGSHNLTYAYTLIWNSTNLEAQKTTSDGSTDSIPLVKSFSKQHEI